LRGSNRSGLRCCAAACVAALVALGALVGCDKVDHDNIDKWLETENGAEKLKKALKSSDNDADLRAHAAENLILHPEGQFVEVKDAFGDMEEEEQHAIMGQLVPRLWEKANSGSSDPMKVSQSNIQAKDALFELRQFADEKTRARIDEYLVEWLTKFYEGRAQTGRVSGRTIIREVGKAAAPKLLQQARSMLVKPAGAEGERLKIGDELLVGLAWSGDPEAAGLLMDMVIKDYKDDSLPKRAIAALHEAYVEPASGTPLPARDAVAPHIAKLAEVAKNESLPGVMNNDSIELIAAVGPPECIQPFVDMAALPTVRRDFRWTGVQRGLRCGGAAAIGPILDTVPVNNWYERALLEKYIWKEILAAPGGSAVAEQVRQLLASKSWVARVTAIEVLGVMSAGKDTAAEDAKRIRALAGDRTVLKEWWGKPKDGGKKRPDPTLGQVAKEVAGRLEGLAKGTETK
jgi:hypothetical protein